MTIITDSTAVKNGTDYSFVCSKIPFSISCSSRLQHGGYNFIDLDLVNKMKIPLQKIKVCRMTYLGEKLRSVGYIDQTVHCVHNGVVQGTVHLSAKVIRNLYDVFDVDCIASAKTFERLVGKPPPDPPDAEEDDEEQQEEAAKCKKNPDEYSKKVTRRRLRQTSSSSSSSDSSDDGHFPVTKDWILRATLLADTAQKDDAGTLLDIENDISNYNEDNSSDNSKEASDSEACHLDPDEANDSYACYDDPQMTNDSYACYDDTTAAKTDEDEENEYDDFHCNLCFQEGKPIRIVSNHDDGCATCPSLTPAQKLEMIGPYWKTQAEMIIKMRYKREQEERKWRYAGP